MRNAKHDARVAVSIYMKPAIFSIFGIVAILVILMQGCGGISNADQVVFPTTSVSYSQQVEPFLTLACNIPGCHDATDAAGGVDLSSWVAIRSFYPGLVDVNTQNPQYDTSSILVKVLFAEEIHNAPLNVNENQRDGIRQWIFEGAQNN
jgi:hypothetical protein